MNVRPTAGAFALREDVTAGKQAGTGAAAERKGLKGAVELALVRRQRLGFAAVIHRDVGKHRLGSPVALADGLR